MLRRSREGGLRFLFAGIGGGGLMLRIPGYGGIC